MAGVKWSLFCVLSFLPYLLKIKHEYVFSPFKGKYIMEYSLWYKIYWFQSDEWMSQQAPCVLIQVFQIEVVGKYKTKSNLKTSLAFYVIFLTF